TGVNTVSTQLLGLVNLLLTGVDTLKTGQASGIKATSPNGLTVLSNGNTYQANSVLVSQANGIALNAIDNLNILGASGVLLSLIGGGGSVAHSNGIALNAIDGLFTINGANGIALNAIDGTIKSIPPGNLMILGAKSGSATNVSNIT